jgi:AcrR family transcriptional regulator
MALREHTVQMPASPMKESAPRRARGRPKLEDVAEIDGRLLEVALSEFLKHGYGGTSMARIIKAAEISKTTLYSRFASKEDLFRAITRRQVYRLATVTPLEAQGARPNLEKGLKAYANRMLEISFQGELLEVNRLIHSEAHRFPELGAAASERTELGIQQVSGFIQTCAQADGVACQDPQGAAEAFIHMIRGWYVNIMLTNRKVPAAERERFVERAVRILLSARKDW